MLVKRGLLSRSEGPLYQAKGLLYWPGASCVIKWASYARWPPISTTGQPVSCILDPVTEASCIHFVHTGGKGTLYTLDSIMCQPGPPFISQGPPVWVKRDLPCWPEGLLYQANGLLYPPGGPLCQPEGLYHAKDLLCRPGGLLYRRGGFVHRLENLLFSQRALVLVRGPPTYTGWHIVLVRASLYQPRASCMVQEGPAVSGK